MTRHGRQILASKSDFATTWTYQATNGKQGCAFPCTVGTKDSDNFTFLNTQIHIVQDFDTAVANMKMREREQRHYHSSLAEPR